MTSSTENPFKRILVLGATGGTGQLIVTEAIARGYAVTAMVRSPEKAGALRGAKLIEGDARDADTLRVALRGQDGVISALGTPVSPVREVTLLSSVTDLLVKAMKEERVSRLIAITGLGAGDSAGHGGFFVDKVIFPLLLRHVYADKTRQEEIIRASHLDWVLVRPSILNNKSDRNLVRAMTDLSDFRGGTISRQGVASFVVDQIETDKWLRKAPAITW